MENIVVSYNLKTYNLCDSDDKIIIEKKKNTYNFLNSKKKYIITFTYKNLKIMVNEILILYVILQQIFKVDTIQKLSELEWNYEYWNIDITTTAKELSDHMIILKFLLNMKNDFNCPMSITELENKIKIKDKRGWGGERPREVYYKFGFPLFTPKTKKTLKNSQRLFQCPFPICNINPTRQALVKNTKIKKCFTCGCEEGDKNFFGNICYFENAHFMPHILGGDDKAGHQCKWCNSFYKDKIAWNSRTGKPTFNVYAILRDAPKNEIIRQLKKLDFKSSDFM